MVLEERKKKKYNFYLKIKNKVMLSIFKNSYFKKDRLLFKLSLNIKFF